MCLSCSSCETSTEAPSQAAGASSFHEEPTLFTLDDIDEALQHARAVASQDRGPAWQAYVDSLLEQRAKVDED